VADRCCELWVSIVIIAAVPVGLLAWWWQFRMLRRHVERWAQETGFQLSEIRMRWRPSRRFGSRLIQGAVYDVCGFDAHGHWRMGRVKVGRLLFQRRYRVEADWESIRDHV
jgi:hypothetical protein